MRRLLATTAIVTGLALLVPVIPATAALAAPAEEAPPNERAPREPVEDGALPWTTKVGQDMKGYRPSTYTGEYYLANREQYRLCVVQRESGGNYDESSGAHVGAYQFSASLAVRALSAMRPEIDETYGKAGLSALGALSGKPMYTWPRFWQDAAFWTIFDHGRGWSHWSSQWGANWNCDHRANAESGWPNPSRYNYSAMKGEGKNRTAVTTTRSGRDDPAASRFGRSPHAFGTPAYSQWLAKKYIKAKHRWAGGHFRALKNMWWRESNWRYEVVNWQGPWYGLGQVNGTFIGQQGFSIAEYRRSPYVQIVVGSAYIKMRYGTPRGAWNFWQSNGWY